ncbi:tail fiber domain-containing protein [Pseudobdellovibrio sp. HCB154]|uniref:tail fiber domain-containing protein n=1 Tax=Pseudobdellovibrio sp. HCB154 TaxID=3386277 RepID=UPI0039173EAB
MKKGRLLNCFGVFIFVFMMLSTLSVFAGPSRTTYQAKIIKPDGYPLESTTVNFKFTILDPAGSCILYSETFSNVNMGSSAGLVSFALGTGVRTFPVIGSNFEQVFSNTVASLICDAGGPATYSPSANDTRKIVMQFNDNTGWQTLPAMTINAVPYAMYANDSLKFSGKDITEFVQTASLPTCGASEAMRFNGAGFSCIAAGGTGTITSGSVITALGYTPADGASITTVTSTVNSVSSTVASVSSTVYSVSSTVTSLQNSVAASFAAITSSQWSTIGADIYYTSRVGVGTSSPSTLFDVGGWPEAPAGLANGANITGNLYVGNTGSNIARTRLSSNVNGGFLQWNRLLTASGAVQTDVTKPSFSFEMNGTTDRFIFQRSAASSTTLVDLMTITGSGRVGIGVSTPVTALEVSGGIRIGSESVACAPSYAGTLRYNAGVVEYCNGTSWAAFGVSGAGILAINGLASGSQTFAFGSSGTTPNVSSVGSVHTFNFPYASVATTTAGVISYSDYLNFSNKQVATSAAIIATLGYTPADSVSLTTLSSTVGSVSSTVANVSSTVNSVSSSVASLQNSVTASLAAITSSQWVTSGTNIYYNTGAVGVGTAQPEGAFNIARTGAPGTLVFVDTYSGTSGINPALVGRSSRGVAGSASATLQSDKLLFIGARGDTGTGFSSTSPVNIIMRASENWSAVSQGTQIEFSTSTNGTSASLERMKITNAGNVGIGTSNPAAKLDVSGAIRIGVDTSSCIAGLAGTIRYNAGVVEYCNGSTWVTFGAAGAGILAINGLTSGSQTFAFGSTGTTPNVSSTGTVHTFNFPYASVATTTAGVISYSDYLTFSNKQSATSAAIAATLGYTPADGASLTTLTSTVGSVSAAVNSVSSTVSSLQNSVTASLAAMTSSQWTTSGANIFYNLGNVGVGTSAPAVAMDIVGSLRVAPSAGASSSVEIGNMNYGSLNPGASTSNGAYIQGPMNASIAVDLRNNQSDDAFAIRYSASNSATVDTIGLVFNGQGRMGLGTSAPAELLHVHAASGTSRAVVRTSWTDTNAYGEWNAYEGATFMGGISVFGSTYATSAYRNAFMMSAANNNLGSLIFRTRTGGTYQERMNILNNGYVGIGTSVPSQRLEVDGGISSISSTDNSTSRSVRINMMTDTVNAANAFGNGDPWLTLDGGANSGSATLQIVGNQNRTLNVRLHDGSLLVPYGNIGVGLVTSAPASRLHVSDNSAVIMTLERQNNQNTLIEYKNTLGSVYAGQITGTTDFGVGTGTDLGASATFRVTNTGRVYIGSTTAPTARLHITAGTSSVAPVKLTLGTLLTTPQAGAIEYDGTDYYITDNSNVRRMIATASTGGVLNNTSVVSSTSGITLWPAAGNSVVVSSTVASTNSTTGALIVNGGAGIAGALNVGGIISGSAVIKGTGYRANQGAPDAADSSTVGYAFGSDGDTGIFSPGTGSANGVLAFYSNNAEKMRVTNNGLGIGTTSPSFPLDVQTAGTITQRLYHASNSQYDDANLILARSRGTISAPTAVLSGDALGGVYFRGHDGSGMTSSSAYIAVSAEQNFTGGAKGTSMKFGTTVSGTGSYQEIMRIHSNGYVGIGNTTPNALLQVGPSGSQPANYNIYLASYRSTAGQGQLVGNWANTDYWAIGPATNSGSDNTLRLGNTTDRTGTWSGTQNLNLVMGGGLAVGSGTVGTYKFIATKNFNGISSETAAFIGGTDAGSIGSGIYVMQKDNLGFNTNTSYLLNVVHNNISKFLVTGLGNVGVGTSAPSEKVHIENTTGQANILIKGMSGATSTRAEVKLDRYDNPRGAGVRMLDSNTGGAQWWAGVPYSNGGATDMFTIGRHTTQPEYVANAMLAVTSAGNVGIGTTTPSVMLTVDDTGGTVSAPYIAATDKLAVMSTGNGVIQITTPASNSAAIYFSDPQSRDPGGVAYSHLTDSMSFRVNQATRMTIASGGAVGIGTGTPATTLHVRSAANYGAVMLGDNGGTSNHHLTHELDGSFGIFTGTFGAGVRQFTIASGGAVGIGVTSPLTALEVNGGISTKGGEIIMQRPVVGGGWARGLHYTPDGSSNATANGLAGIGLLGSGSTQTSIYLAFGASPWASSSGMHILSNGNVGIGLTNPTALLHVNGAALATAWNTSSDKRLKENIKPIENSVDKILQLRGVEFDWRKDVKAPTKHDETHDIGVIAQEVEKVFPEAVTTPKTGYKSVAYSKLVAPLIEAVKSLYHRILGVEAQQVEQARTIASKADQQALDMANAKIQKLESENAAKEKELQEMKLRLEKIEKALNSK